MRAVLDPNVIISALLSPTGTPARVLRAWCDGAFELVVSAGVLQELERALGYPKLAKRISSRDREEVLELLRTAGGAVEDPDDPPTIQSPDPGDDYLIALASASRAVIVSGDGHVLGLADRIPVYSPAGFLELLAEQG